MLRAFPPGSVVVHTRPAVQICRHARIHLILNLNRGTATDAPSMHLVDLDGKRVPPSATTMGGAPHNVQGALVPDMTNVSIGTKSPGRDGHAAISQPSDSIFPADTTAVPRDPPDTKNKDIKPKWIVHRHHYVKKPFPYLSGRPWRALPVKPFRDRNEIVAAPDDRQTIPESEEYGVFENLDASQLFTVKPSNNYIKDKNFRRDLLHVIANTQSAVDAWTAYATLLAFPQKKRTSSQQRDIPFQHLHRLCRLLARNRPKTREQFMRLLSVLYTIHISGGEVRLEEWTALIDNAGRGWRKASPEDFKLALEVFMDMVSGKPPGATFRAREEGVDYEEEETNTQSIPTPNIITYTTLINLAANTLCGSAVRRASSLLAASGLAPSRITHLSLLKYFSASRQLSGVRSTLRKMNEQGLELGLDGINACIWAFGRNDRIDLSMRLYRILRHNINPETSSEELNAVARMLHGEEGITIVPNMKPNEVTFTLMTQLMAYRGNFTAALNVFMDMLSVDNIEVGAPLYRNKDTGEMQPAPYSTTLSIFRAIFLGFYRHGVSNEQVRLRIENSEWTLRSLRSLFELFLELPTHVQPGGSVIYWIIMAFDKTSGHDVALLREVWKVLEKRFQEPRGGPEHRLVRMKTALFDFKADGTSPKPSNGSHLWWIARKG